MTELARRQFARQLQRAALLALALSALSYGVWLGLVRLGWILPLPRPNHLILHGPLMVGGFLGTLIGLERAVRVAKPWAYSAPILTVAASLTLVLDFGGSSGPILMTASSAVLLVICGVVLVHETSLSVWTMALGALAWLAGNAIWLSGAPLYRVVPWWIGFLVLTIAGERVALNRLSRPSSATTLALVVAVGVLAAGITLVSRGSVTGVRVMGIGLVGVSAWLACMDLPRQAIRQGGITWFMTVSLLASYVWLGIGGVIAAVTDAAMPGLPYDAFLHAIFLGFAVAMVMGHATVVAPKILGLVLPSRSALYLPIGMLHGSVIVRVIGDLNDGLGRLRSWGGILNALALLAFIVSTAWSIISARKP